MMALKTGGRQRSAKTLAPGNGADKDNAAGDNLLLGIILMPPRDFVNLSCAICCIGGR